MSVVFSKPQNRLAWRAGSTGLSRAQAVEQATVQVEDLRQPTISYIDENLELLFLLFAQTVDAASAPYVALYDASNAIAGTAPLFGLNALGTGAFHFCELLAHLEHENNWNAPAVKVFLDGLLVMRHLAPASESDDAILILENLGKLLSYISIIK